MEKRGFHMIDTKDERARLEPDCSITGHSWERKYKEIDCDTCKYKAGPGDWGMCMPDAGGDFLCINSSSEGYDQCSKCHKIRLKDGSIVSSDWFND
jgi:hypothetical protein